MSENGDRSSSESHDPKAVPEDMVVGLFVTCLADLFRPSVAFAAAKLIEAAGAQLVVPKAQTCCGQPAYNSGDQKTARKMAGQIIKTFRNVDYVVAPSGSCAGMLRKHIPDLFDESDPLYPHALSLSERTHELTSFLTDVLGVKTVDAQYDGLCAYHDSCSSLREMGVRGQPRTLLAGVEGLAVRDLPGAEVCCGFGGTFCVKYPDISTRMAGDKVDEIVATGADTLLAGDLGCLMNLSGLLHRRGHKIKTYHVAEVLAGMTDGVAPIGAAADKQPPEENR